MISTLLAPLLAWTGVMISLYLAFNPWTLKSMEMPGPARQLRQATLTGEGFYTFHQFAISSLQRFISRFILMDEVTTSSSPLRPRKKRIPFRNRVTLPSFGIERYLNVDAFETVFLLAQGYTTLALFLSFLSSGKSAFLEVSLSANDASGLPLLPVIWFTTSFLSAAIFFGITLDREKSFGRPEASVREVFSDLTIDLWLFVIFEMLFLTSGAMNQFSSVWLSINLAGLMLYSCTRGVLFTATTVSFLCQLVVFFSMSSYQSAIAGLLAITMLWTTQYKFARAHGMGPLLPTVQTRRFSWVYFISAHMAAPIVFFLVSHGARPYYYLILLVFAVIPLTNSVMDWFSVAITRYLMEETKRRARSIRALLLYLFIDAGITIALVLIMLFLILSIIVHMNRVQQDFSGSILVPVLPILRVLKNDPLSSEIGWLTFMLLMTVIPTLIHYLIVWFSIGIWTTSRMIIAIDRRFGLSLWRDEISGEVNWDKLQAAASLHTAMLLLIIWFVGAGLWIALLGLEILLRADVVTVWRALIDVAAVYCEWLSGIR
jgi:hypothetical protein